MCVETSPLTAAKDCARSAERIRNSALGHLLGPVILAITNALGSQKIKVAIRTTASPLLHDVEHIAMNFHIRITHCRMVEYLNDIVKNLVFRHLWMFPSIDNAGCGEFENFGCDLSCRLVEDVREVILR